MGQGSGGDAPRRQAPPDGAPADGLRHLVSFSCPLLIPLLIPLLLEPLLSLYLCEMQISLCWNACFCGISVR